MLNRLLNRLLNLGLGCCFWLAARCSRVWSVRIARGVAWLLIVVDSDTARFTRMNLHKCFPGLDAREHRELLRHSLAHMALLFFELAQLRYWELDQLLQSVRVQGKATLDEAFSNEHGVLLLVPHFGNWELMCAYLGHYYTVAALYDPPKMSAVERLVLDARQRYGGKMFPIDTGGMRSVFRELRNGQLVAILPDQVPDRSAGVYVPFFGHTALTMTLPNRLIQKARPTVLLGSVRRCNLLSDGDDDRELFGDYGYELSFQKIFEDRDEVLSAEQSATRINLAIEEVVRTAPAQYQWEYKRFKRPPEGGKPYRRQ